MADWFSSLTSIGNQISDYADSIADSLVAQANEAQEQLARERQKMKDENERTGQQAVESTDLLMPWETTDETKAILSQALMEKVGSDLYSFLSYCVIT